MLQKKVINDGKLFYKVTHEAAGVFYQLTTQPTTIERAKSPHQLISARQHSVPVWLQLMANKWKNLA